MAIFKWSSKGGIFLPLPFGTSIMDIKASIHPDCDIQVIKMSLPDGSYTLNFFNPVTEEKMVINLEI